jgi:hypothetical protein
MSNVSKAPQVDPKAPQANPQQPQANPQQPQPAGQAGGPHVPAFSPGGKPVPPVNPVPADPVRKAGELAEAATTRVGGTPGRDVIISALQELEQRTIDRLGEDHKKGSRDEFDRFRDHLMSIIGDPEE